MRRHHLYQSQGRRHLPADDRRHFVAWCDYLNKEDFTETYWTEFWSWLEHGGIEHVGHYLGTLDLSGFNPKAPPPTTRAFWDIVNSGRAPENAELADALDAIGRPSALTLGTIRQRARSEFAEWLQDRKNRRQIPHRLEECGYVPVHNDCAKDGLWKIGGRRQAVYAKRELSDGDQIAAAQRLAR